MTAGAVGLAAFGYGDLSGWMLFIIFLFLVFSGD